MWPWRRQRRGCGSTNSCLEIAAGIDEIQSQLNQLSDAKLYISQGGTEGLQYGVIIAEADTDRCVATVHEAVAAGINLIDHTEPMPPPPSVNAETGQSMHAAFPRRLGL
jgi:hypothetical protein